MGRSGVVGLGKDEGAATNKRWPQVAFEETTLRVRDFFTNFQKFTNINLIGRLSRWLLRPFAETLPPTSVPKRCVLVGNGWRLTSHKIDFHQSPTLYNRAFLKLSLRKKKNIQPYAGSLLQYLLPSVIMKFEPLLHSLLALVFLSIASATVICEQCRPVDLQTAPGASINSQG